MPHKLIKELIKIALAEDIGSGDITTRLLVPKNMISRASITAKEAGILSGINVAADVFKAVDPKLNFSKKLKDGAVLKKGSVIAYVYGRVSSILTAERTALNFLQRLCGIATLANKFAKKVKGTKAVILDTRKTGPGMRLIEKKAVSDGGAANHRFGLYDAILIKDNHIKILGGIKNTLTVASRHCLDANTEIEAKNINEVKTAVSYNVKRILLDNMKIPDLKKAVKIIRKSGKKISIEASGGITLENVSKIAKTGVDFISVGAMTHSAKALDISLGIETGKF